MTERHCSGAVLAGGANVRFGGLPKGLMELAGRRLVDRVFDTVRLVCDESFLITNDSTVADAVAGVRVHGDTRSERASLVGLHSALNHCREAALVVAWDMPFVSPNLLARLRALGEAASAAAIPVGPRGAEPLCAYYPRAVLDVVERQLHLGELRLSSFVGALASPVIMSPNDVARFGPADWLFANINTPADLDALSDGSRIFEQHSEDTPVSLAERR
jgi:molybdenum cofactor guanylyltransferase